MVRSIPVLSLLLAFVLPVAAADIPLSAPGATVPSGARARSAEGGGVDLVVWEERTAERVVLKASRVGSAGAPLDGDGIVVADDILSNPHPNAVVDFGVAFDGEAFVVAWRRHDGDGTSLLVRTITPGGVPSEPRVVVTLDGLYNLQIAGGGGGRSAITWGGWKAPSPALRSYLVALVRGSPGTPVELAPMYFSSADGIGATARGYLAVSTWPEPCQITCEPEGPLYARSFAFDGTPTSEPILLDTSNANRAEVLSNGESLFVSWGDSVLHVDDAVNVVRKSKLARRGWASLDGSEIRIDAGSNRAVYSSRGLLRRFEPLLLQKEEAWAGAISGRRVLVLTGPASARRLVIRSLESAPAADLAVVATGALLPSNRYSYERLVVFRIEHRGGAPVNRIDLWWSRGWTVIPHETTWQGGILPRPLHEGESFEVAIPVNEWFLTDELWIAGDVVDAHPSNNIDGYRRPARTRGRTVGR